jgi:hypothetical protein
MVMHLLRLRLIMALPLSMHPSMAIEHSILILVSKLAKKNFTLLALIVLLKPTQSEAGVSSR